MDSEQKETLRIINEALDRNFENPNMVPSFEDYIKIEKD